MKRLLSEIESALTASGQKPNLLEIKFDGRNPKEIIGNIFHNQTRRKVKWDAVTGKCEIHNSPAPEHNLIFTSN